MIVRAGKSGVCKEGQQARDPRLRMVKLQNLKTVIEYKHAKEQREGKAGSLLRREPNSQLYPWIPTS